MKNCHIEIDVWTPALGFSLIQMNYTDKSHEVPNIVIEETSGLYVNTTIDAGNGISVTYTGMNKTESTLMFDVYDHLTGKTEKFDFSMRYWESYTHMQNNDQMNSGAYAFHPMVGQLHPYPYGDVKEVSVQKGNYSQYLHFKFGTYEYGEKNESKTSVVHVSIDKD